MFYWCLVAKSCPTLLQPYELSSTGSSVHGISQERILEWVAISFSRGSSWLRDWTCVSCVPCINIWIIYHWTTREAHQMFREVHFSSVTQSCPTLCNPWIAALQAFLSITNSQSSLKLMSIELVMPSSHLTLCHSLLLLPPIPPSIGVFSNESTLRLRWLKYWSFSFSISPSKEHPGLVSFRMGWLDLLAVQGILKSLLQHHSSEASILWCSNFFIV